MYKKSRIENQPVALKLTKETLVNLSGDALKVVAGGMVNQSNVSHCPSACPLKC
jgi:hypothetical protein